MVHNSSEYVHTLIEALSLSFADTLWYNADPSKVAVPVSGLLSKEYAAKRRALIKPDRFVLHTSRHRRMYVLLPPGVSCLISGPKRGGLMIREGFLFREWGLRETGGLFQIIIYRKFMLIFQTLLLHQ